MSYQELAEDIKNDLPSKKTSLVEVTNKLPMKPPCRIFFKNEYEQPCGSFKLRGIGTLIYKEICKARQKFPSKRIHVFASSGGNAGLAAAYLAQYYHVSCTVFLPITTKSHVIKKLHSYNAETVMCGNNIYEADKNLKKMLLETKKSVYPIYCHPFDNPAIWEGHASLVDEIYEEQIPGATAKDIRGLVCSVGGGGLYNGLMKGLYRNSKSDTEILLVETDQAPTLRETVKAKKIITLKSVKSLATSLACSYLSEQSLQNYFKSKFKTHIVSIDDQEAVKATVDFYNNFGIVVEPACGTSLSVAYNKIDFLTKHFKDLLPNDIIVVVVCGGSCSTEDDIISYRRSLKNGSKL